jgi:hypothetical protein
MANLASGSAYACSWTGCERTYKRRDHLERHERTRELSWTRFPCCWKPSRADACCKMRAVLATSAIYAAQLFHGGEDAKSDLALSLPATCSLDTSCSGMTNPLPQSAGLARRRGESPVLRGAKLIPSLRCTSVRMACDGVPPRQCARCQRSDVDCRYRPASPGNRSASPDTHVSSILREHSVSSDRPVPLADSQPASDVVAPSSIGMFSNDMYPSGGDAYPQDPLFALDTLGSVAGAAQVSMQPSVPTSGPVSDPFDSPGKWFESVLADAGREETSPTWLTNLLLSATVDEKIGQSSHPNAGLQQFDWGLTDLLDHEVFEPIGTHAPGSPAVPEREADLVLAVEAEEMDGQPHAAELPDGLPRESTWVSTSSCLS